MPTPLKEIGIVAQKMAGSIEGAYLAALGIPSNFLFSRLTMSVVNDPILNGSVKISIMDNDVQVGTTRTVAGTAVDAAFVYTLLEGHSLTVLLDNAAPDVDTVTVTLKGDFA